MHPLSNMGASIVHLKFVVLYEKEVSFLHERHNEDQDFSRLVAKLILNGHGVPCPPHGLSYTCKEEKQQVLRDFEKLGSQLAHKSATKVGNPFQLKISLKAL